MRAGGTRPAPCQPSLCRALPAFSAHVLTALWTAGLCAAVSLSCLRGAVPPFCFFLRTSPLVGSYLLHVILSTCAHVPRAGRLFQGEGVRAEAMRIVPCGPSGWATGQEWGGNGAGGTPHRATGALRDALRAVLAVVRRPCRGRNPDPSAGRAGVGSPPDPGAGGRFPARIGAEGGGSRRSGQGDGAGRGRISVSVAPSGWTSQPSGGSSWVDSSPDPGAQDDSGANRRQGGGGLAGRRSAGRSVRRSSAVPWSGHPPRG